LESLYVRNGAIYVSQPSLIEGGRMWGDYCFAYIMPEERSMNINTEFEFRLAELWLAQTENARASSTGPIGPSFI